jgi:hypothetical protein
VNQLKQEIERLNQQLKEAKREPVWGSLEGRVVFKGELPKIKSLEEQISQHPDKAAILKAPRELLQDPTYRIDPRTRGVANVAVFLKRPANGMLPIHAEDKVRKEPMVMDAPFCVFQPHMVALYPEWFDGMDRGETGQKFTIKNSSVVGQAVHVATNPPRAALTLPQQEQTMVLKPQPLPVIIQCNIHVWMQARAWVFDHPYYAITKEDGTFTIPRVPAGTEVQVMAWHESQGWLFTKNGKTMKLNQGKNTLDFEISSPVER